MAQDHCSSAARHNDTIEHSANGHQPKVLTLPIGDRPAPNDGNIESKIGDRALFAKRHFGNHSPTHEFQVQQSIQQQPIAAP